MVSVVIISALHFRQVLFLKIYQEPIILVPNLILYHHWESSCHHWCCNLDFRVPIKVSIKILHQILQFTCPNFCLSENEVLPVSSSSYSRSDLSSLFLSTTFLLWWLHGESDHDTFHFCQNYAPKWECCYFRLPSVWSYAFICFALLLTKNCHWIWKSSSKVKMLFGISSSTEFPCYAT